MNDFDDDRDYWQEYKDDLAMGRIDRDGNQLEPPEPDPEPDPEDEWQRHMVPEGEVLP